MTLFPSTGYVSSPTTPASSILCSVSLCTIRIIVLWPWSRDDSSWNRSLAHFTVFAQQVSCAFGNCTLMGKERRLTRIMRRPASRLFDVQRRSNQAVWISGPSSGPCLFDVLDGDDRASQGYSRYRPGSCWRWTRGTGAWTVVGKYDGPIGCHGATAVFGAGC